MNDLDERKDIEKLISRFYEKVQADALLGPVFSHVDWEKHLPIMYSFWASMMLGELSYQGNPYEKHVHLPIGTEHFQQWLKLFTETVDTYFEGPHAEEIKTRAQSIAGIFQHKMGLASER